MEWRMLWRMFYCVIGGHSVSMWCKLWYSCNKFSPRFLCIFSSFFSQFNSHQVAHLFSKEIALSIFTNTKLGPILRCFHRTTIKVERVLNATKVSTDKKLFTHFAVSFFIPAISVFFADAIDGAEVIHSTVLPTTCDSCCINGPIVVSMRTAEWRQSGTVFGGNFFIINS